MNVLYVHDDQATLVTATQSARGPLSTLRAMAGQIKAKGQAILVLSGETVTANLPPNLPSSQVLPYLDGQRDSTVSVTGLADGDQRWVILFGQERVHAARTAARSAGLNVINLVPLTSAALRAADVNGSAVIVHDLGAEHDFTIVSKDKVIWRRATAGRSLIDAVNRALQPLLSSGDTAQVILITPDDLPAHGLELPQSVKFTALPLTEALRGAALKGNSGFASYERPLTSKRQINKVALGVLGSALLVNGCIWLAATLQHTAARRLQDRALTLERQAEEFQGIKAANDRQEARNSQARALTEAKGQLYRDLPLLASRVAEAGGSLQSLAGPELADGEAIRGFGSPVERSYTLKATTYDAEAFVSAFTRDGLRANVSNVACIDGQACQVEFKAAPVKVEVATVPAAPLRGQP